MASDGAPAALASARTFSSAATREAGRCGAGDSAQTESGGTSWERWAAAAPELAAAFDWWAGQAGLDSPADLCAAHGRLSERVMKFVARQVAHVHSGRFASAAPLPP